MRAVEGRIIVKPENAGERSVNGLIVLEDAAYYHGIVVAVGAEMNTVDVGDRVIFSKYVGGEFVHDGQTYMSMTEYDVLVVL